MTRDELKAILQCEDELKHRCKKISFYLIREDGHKLFSTVDSTQAEVVLLTGMFSAAIQLADNCDEITLGDAENQFFIFRLKADKEFLAMNLVDSENPYKTKYLIKNILEKYTPEQDVAESTKNLFTDITDEEVDDMFRFVGV